MLKCVAVCVAACDYSAFIDRCDGLSYPTRMCCNVLQYGAMFGSVLQRDVWCCSVLQCIAECCNVCCRVLHCVLQCVHSRVRTVPAGNNSQLTTPYESYCIK